MASRLRKVQAVHIATVQRVGGPDDPRLPAMRRDLRALELEEHIRRLVDQMPPLTAEQRERLAGLLSPRTA